MPQLLTLEGWVAAYVDRHPFTPDQYRAAGDNSELLAYLTKFAGTLMTAAVAQKLLQEALKPEPEDTNGRA